MKEKDLKITSRINVTEGTKEISIPGQRDLIRGDFGEINYLKIEIGKLKVGDFFSGYRKYPTRITPPIYVVTDTAIGKLLGLFLLDVANQRSIFEGHITDQETSTFSSDNDMCELTRYTPTKKDRAVAAPYLC